MLHMTWAIYLYAQNVYMMCWSLIRVSVATWLFMKFEHRFALYGTFLVLWCRMDPNEFLFMHEMSNFVYSDSEVWKMMSFMEKLMHKFAVFTQRCSRSGGQWSEQVTLSFCESACQWPLCRFQHATIFLWSSCLGEYPDVYGSQNGHVFDVQNAFLVKLDTLCKFDIWLMISKGFYEWYAQRWCGWCAWQVYDVKFLLLWGGHWHACQWPLQHMHDLTLPLCCPYCFVLLVKFLC